MRCPTIAELPAPPGGKKGWPWTEECSELPDTMPDGDPWPRISIVTPSYNQGQFIEETIRSVLLQGYPNLEYIIIDGGSTDGSVEIIRKYEEWLTYWVSEPDGGQSNAINKGFKKASGEVYTWLNSDDYLLKDALRNISLAYMASPEAGGWCGGCYQVKVNGDILSTIWPKRLDVEGIADWKENMFVQPACFFSAKAWGKCGPLDENLHYAMDFNLWLSIAKEFHIEQVNSMLAAACIHKDAKMQTATGHMFAEVYLIQIRHGFEHIAIEDISRWVDMYLELSRKLDRIYRFPLIQLIMPIARIVWKKLL